MNGVKSLELSFKEYNTDVKEKKQTIVVPNVTMMS